MKGVVVQVQGRSAAVLTDDGCVKKSKTTVMKQDR